MLAMRYFKKLSEFLKLVTIPLIGAIVIGYFVYHSIKGDHGLSAYLLLAKEVLKAENVLKEKSKERDRIEHHTTLLRGDNLDLDTLDERARLVLNLIERDERIILD